jgi:hypothetical protein
MVLTSLDSKRDGDSAKGASCSSSDMVMHFRFSELLVEQKNSPRGPGKVVPTAARADALFGELYLKI